MPDVAVTDADASGPSGTLTDDIRRHNLGTALRYVHLRGPTPRTELARQLGVNRSTISGLAAELSRAGLVQETVPTSAGRAGRPSLVMAPDPRSAYVLAGHVTDERVVAASFGLGGVVLDRVEGTGPATADVNDLTPLLSQLARRAAGHCVGLGVATHQDPARVVAGVETNGPTPPTAADPPLPTPTVAAEAEVAILAEHLRGSAIDATDAILLHRGVGSITTGVIVGGRLLSGHTRGAGHMVVNPGGRPCSCGSRGCWGAEVDACWASAGAGAQSWKRLAGWLALGIANLVNIFRPQVVIIGGTLTEAYPIVADLLLAECERLVIPTYRSGWRLVPAALGAGAPLVGAAEQAFQRLFADPLGTLPTPRRVPERNDTHRVRHRRIV